MAKGPMKKLVQEKATLIETYVDDYLSNWRKAMEAPAVIRLAHFMFPPAKKRYERFTRKNIWLRDKGKCQYCTRFIPLKHMHWDHVLPQDQGGKTNWYNIVCACWNCNQKKANGTSTKRNDATHKES
jgi:5-methylcytosine-specific restriction endonuclease McrA